MPKGARSSIWRELPLPEDISSQGSGHHRYFGNGQITAASPVLEHPTPRSQCTVFFPYFPNRLCTAPVCGEIPLTVCRPACPVEFTCPRLRPAPRTQHKQIGSSVDRGWTMPTPSWLRIAPHSMGPINYASRPDLTASTITQCRWATSQHAKTEKTPANRLINEIRPCAISNELSVSIRHAQLADATETPGNHENRHSQSVEAWRRPSKPGRSNLKQLAFHSGGTRTPAAKRSCGSSPPHGH
jgi:hypothetical protein